MILPNPATATPVTPGPSTPLAITPPVQTAPPPSGNQPAPSTPAEDTYRKHLEEQVKKSGFLKMLRGGKDSPQIIGEQVDMMGRFHMVATLLDSFMPGMGGKITALISKITGINFDQLPKPPGASTPISGLNKDTVKQALTTVFNQLKDKDVTPENFSTLLKDMAHSVGVKGEPFDKATDQFVKKAFDEGKLKPENMQELTDSALKAIAGQTPLKAGNAEAAPAHPGATDASSGPRVVNSSGDLGKTFRPAAAGVESGRVPAPAAAPRAGISLGQG